MKEVKVALRKESVDRNLSILLGSALLMVSLSARRAWIEMPMGSKARIGYRSLSARRAWIEIKIPRAITDTGLVALRKESVDRNRCSYLHSNMSLDVALRKESVDRNLDSGVALPPHQQSLSARRAWIEIMGRYAQSFRGRKVALRKESVDRNYIIKITVCRPASLSARRAWIEIDAPASAP